MTEKQFENILEQALCLKKSGLSEGEIVARFPTQYRKELAASLKLTSRIKATRDNVLPSQHSFDKMLSSLPAEQSLINYHRQPFGLWKFAIPALAVFLIIIGIFYKLEQRPVSTSLTASNTDQIINQTNQSIDQATAQVDQDLAQFDQSQNSEGDLNNI